MSMAHISYEALYKKNSLITFDRSESGELKVEITTDRLQICSVTLTDREVSNYTNLFGNREVMEKFATGETRDREYVVNRIRGWVERWQRNDPYAGFSVFKRENGVFVGHVVLGHGDLPGESELAYLFHKEYWNQGFGTEAVTALVEDFAPATHQGFTLMGKTITRIHATSRKDNIASIRILKKLGFQQTSEEEKYGALRYHFTKELTESQTQTSKKISHCCCIL